MSKPFSALLFSLISCLSTPLLAQLPYPARAPVSEGTVVTAHRFGSKLNPENTLMALKASTNDQSFHAAYLETDMHVTKDNQLVILHDAILDRVTNAAPYFHAHHVAVKDHTLSELYPLNFGENFETRQGTYPYRGLRGSAIPQDLGPLTLARTLDYLKAQPGSHVLLAEVKDPLFRGFKAVDLLYTELQRTQMLEHTILASFHPAVLLYAALKHPDLARGAGPINILTFYGAYLLNLDPAQLHFDFKILPMPYHFILFHLLGIGKKDFNEYARKNGLITQYWTVNDAKVMKILQENGADAVITDAPDLAWSVFHDYARILKNYSMQSLLMVPNQFASLAGQILTNAHQNHLTVTGQILDSLQNPPHHPGLSFFADIHLSHSGNTAAVNSNHSPTLNLGLLYHFSSARAIGALVSTEQNSKNTLASLHSQRSTTTLTVWGLFPLGPQAWVNPTISGGKTHFNSLTRLTHYDYFNFEENGKTDAYHWDMGLDFGYNVFLHKDWLLIPTLGYHHRHVFLQGYQEHNPMDRPTALYLHNLSIPQNLINVGATLSTHNRPSNFSISAMYYHVLSGKTADVAVHFPNTHQVWHTKEMISAKDWGEITLGANFKLSPKMHHYYRLSVRKAAQQKASPSITLGLKGAL
jgi:glycerophosphodiester phosphodiesterase